jgi:hypothetical protein
MSAYACAQRGKCGAFRLRRCAIARQGELRRNHFPSGLREPLKPESDIGFSLYS